MSASRDPHPQAGPSATDDDVAYWLALLRCPGIGPARYQILLEHYQQPQQLFDLSPDELAGIKLPAASRNWLRQPDWTSIDRDLDWLNSDPRHHILTLHDPRYPASLKEIDSPPPLLYAKGDPALLRRQQLGIVGSRNPSAGGRENALNFARDLSQAGLTITSGLALGIDAAAHQGALQGTAKTIAVTGTGLDRLYPARNKALAYKIAEEGLIVSEFPIGTAPKPDHFPRRNRIISGLSLGVLVVEAAPQSGSLITARLAGEQGREVFAIPGSIHNPLAKGCHQLIRQGAKLVETVSDISEEIAPMLSAPSEQGRSVVNGSELNEEAKTLLPHIGYDPISIDSLIARSQLSADKVCANLLVLELAGMVCSAPGGHYIRAS